MDKKKQNKKKGWRTLLFFTVLFSCVASACIKVVSAQEENPEEERRPLYDAAYLSGLLEKTGFAEKRTRAAVEGQTVYTEVLAEDQGVIDLVKYGEMGQPWEVVDSWSEGILGAGGEWAYCADPTVGFRPGYKVVCDAGIYYNQYTIDTIGCAFAWYDQWKQTLGFSFTSGQDYFFKQILVWEVLNEVNGWYPGITLEFGNNVLCPDGIHYISEYTAQVLTGGIEAATDPAWRARWKCSGVLLKGNGQDLCQWQYEPAGGYIELWKKSGNPGFSGKNPCYSLAGAKYGIYRGEQLVSTLETDERGYARSGELEAGNYQLREIQAPAGYGIDYSFHEVMVESGQTTELASEDPPLSADAKIELYKLDAGTGEPVPQGSASLTGAQFKVSYYGGYYTEETLPEQPDRSWILETREEESTEEGQVISVARLSETYKIGGDDFFYLPGIREPVLPLGTLVVEEQKAPEGYLLEGALFQDAQGKKESTDRYLLTVRENNDTAQLSVGNRYYISDQVCRGDFALTKIEEKTQKAMAGIPFQITSKTTGESHVIVTDRNGYYSSASDYVPHSADTNAGTAQSGLWFGLDKNGGSVPVDDRQGALPYDTYQIRELACEQNKGKELYQGEFTITRDNFQLELGTIENADTPRQEREEPPEEKPGKTSPVRTGDEAVMGMYAGGILLSVAICIWVCLDKRRKRR